MREESRSLARRWAPDEPVVGVQVISAKPPWFATPPVAWSLQAGARLLGTGPRNGKLGARRYTALLAERITDPVVEAAADLLIRPDLGHFSWLRFGEVEMPRRRGREAAARALAALPTREPVPA